MLLADFVGFSEDTVSPPPAGCVGGDGWVGILEEERGPAGEGGVDGYVGADLVVGEAEVAGWRVGGEGVYRIRKEEDEEGGE